MLIELSLHRTAHSSLQEQVVEQIRRSIVQGQLGPGSELPSSRELAQQYQVSRNTITIAYDRLIGEGYLETVKGVGTRVADHIPDACLLLDDRPALEGPNPLAVDHPPIVFRGQGLAIPQRSLPHPAIDLWPGRPNNEHFPLTAWRRLADEALAGSASGLVEYGDPAGLLELRETIARHVTASRGLGCSADRVVITSGTQDAINLLARMLVSDGTGVVMENPGYGSAARIFEGYGGRIMPVPVDENGISTGDLPATGARVAYVTPSHQFPTGVPLSTDRRRELLEWAYRTGAYVIEDDYDSDFNYSGPPLMSLAGSDRSHSVVYIGTFSKALGAGVRTGFMVLPPQLVDAAVGIKTMSSYGHPWLEQAILARFLRGEAFQRHLRFIRKAYAETLEHLTRRLNAEFGPVELWGTHNGMHVMWRLPHWVGSAADFKVRLAQRGVHVHTLASGGAYDAESGFGENSILLGYAALNQREVAAAATTMARVAETYAVRSIASEADVD